MHRRKQQPEPQTFIIHKNSEEYEIWDKETKEIARKQHTNQTIKRVLVSGLVYVVRGIYRTYKEIEQDKQERKEKQKEQEIKDRIQELKDYAQRKEEDIQRIKQEIADLKTVRE